MVELVDTVASRAAASYKGVSVRLRLSVVVRKGMVQRRTRRKVGDNSGVRERRCIHVQKGVGTGATSAGVGKVVRGSVTKYRAGTKWKRGMRVKGVRVMGAKERRRSSGGWVRINSNGVVLVSGKMDPRAQRSRIVICRERRDQGFGKVLARSVYVV